MIGMGGGSRDRPVRAAVGGRDSERDCWLALSMVAGIGPAGFAQLIRRHGSAAAAWRAGPEGLSGLARLPEHAPTSFSALRRLDARALARNLERATQRAGGRVVTALEDAYPPALMSMDPRPPTLYIRGSSDVFSQRAVAIVGTRRASGYGLSVATELADELARAGVAVVSGLALGIDGAAHRASVAAGAPGVAVLPSPLDRIYPPRHLALARDILAAGGALVSEVAVGAPVGKPDFARRNRIIAGLAEAVVVVEAPDGSGALLTAQAAISIGRELYAVPGQIDAQASRGCNRLIADHQAAILTSPGSLLAQIGLSNGAAPPISKSLSEVEGLLLSHLLKRSGSIEELVDRAQQPPAAVASALTLLEARGLVNTFGGATFHPTLVARRLAKVV